MKNSKSQKGQIGIIIILGIIILGSFFFAGGPIFYKKSVPVPGREAVNLQDLNTGSPNLSLQLKTLKQTAPTPTSAPTSSITPTITPIPTPIAWCSHNNHSPADATCVCREVKIYCENGVCRDIIPGTNNCLGKPLENPHNVACRSHGINFTGYLCIAKPVIYLYPTRETFVDVSVETEGEIVVSDPLYPEGGWKNVLARPSGDLIYNGKEYRELFYESSVTDVKTPDSGVIVRKEDVDKTLKELNKKLGLTEFESKELTDFWTSRLTSLNSNYILISLVNKTEKNKVDKINIKPNPDTLIEVLYYFKALDKKIDVSPLRLSQAPKRNGFVAVEWGGVIDNN